MTGLTHSVRNSLADRERTFALGGNALHWRDDKAKGAMPYADVRDMRLISYASPNGTCFQCALRGKSGDKVKLRSQHYVSLNNFDDRRQSYAPFVRELASRVAARSPEAAFIAGSTGLWIVWLVVGVLCAGFVLLLILSLFEALPPIGAWVIAAVIVLASLPLAWRQMKAGAARRFDPLAPPPELIGAA